MDHRFISVIGAGSCPDTPEGKALYEKARKVGNLLATNGFAVVCGGLSGVMEAVCKGASEAGGMTMGLLPGNEQSSANDFVKVAVATGLGQMRNHLVVLNGLCAVAIGGGAGTLSEIGHALKMGRIVIDMGDWSDIDGVQTANSPEDVVELVKKAVG